jgi:hypothetical protein
VGLERLRDLGEHLGRRQVLAAAEHRAQTLLAEHLPLLVHRLVDAIGPQEQQVPRREIDRPAAGILLVGVDAEDHAGLVELLGARGPDEDEPRMARVHVPQLALRGIHEHEQEGHELALLDARDEALVEPRHDLPGIVDELEVAAHRGLRGVRDQRGADPVPGHVADRERVTGGAERDEVVGVPARGGDRRVEEREVEPLGLLGDRREQVALDALRDLQVLLEPDLLEGVGEQARVLDRDRELLAQGAEQREVARREFAPGTLRVDVDRPDDLALHEQRGAHDRAQLQVEHRLAELEGLSVRLHDRADGLHVGQAPPHDARAVDLVARQLVSAARAGDADAEAIRVVAQEQQRALSLGDLQRLVDDGFEHMVEREARADLGDALEEHLERALVRHRIAGQEPGAGRWLGRPLGLAFRLGIVLVPEEKSLHRSLAA